jgi:hypothetical protein
MESKICNKCNINKLLTEFNKRSREKDGYNKICKVCYKEQRKKKITDISALIIEKQCNTCKLIKSVSKFKTNAKSTDGFFYKCNDCWKPIQWNKEKQKSSEKKYVENNRGKIKEKWRKQGQKINRRLRNTLNHRISEMFESQKSYKKNKTLNYIDCNLEFLKLWFEFQFEPNMGWNNYGDWHIDHVLPCTYFNLHNEIEQKQCFNWRNLRPCWKLENIKKGNKIIDSIINNQKIKVEKFLKINPLPTQPGDRVEGIE